MVSQVFVTGSEAQGAPDKITADYSENGSEVGNKNTWFGSPFSVADC